MKQLFLVLAACVLVACDSTSNGPDDNNAGGSGDGSDGQAEDNTPAVVDDGPLAGTCPGGFTAAQGNNDGFVSDGVERRFRVFLPDDTSTPRPVFVSLTGTEQAELAFASQSGLDDLTNSGWIVVSPYRRCSTEERNCNGPGSMGTNDGRTWEPWYDTTYTGSGDEGPDVRFVEAAVRCMAASWPVDKARIYVGGISAGGTFSNRNLTYNSDFFAGGIPSSGNWGTGVHPVIRAEMQGTIVIQIWGGATDVWPLENPIANYAPDTKEAAIYYAAQPNVVTVSCSGDHGHAWPANLELGPPFAGTTLSLGNEITNWAAETLLSHPMGSDPADFVLPDPPPELRCVLGEYTDH